MEHHDDILDAVCARDRNEEPGTYGQRLSWNEYLEREDPPEYRLEFEEGRLLVSPTGRTAHDVLRDLLLVWLSRYEEEVPSRCWVISEHSFFMPPGRRDYRPDVALVLDDRKDRPIDPEGWMIGAPDIAIEVLSPSTEDLDRGLKARRYFEQGSDEYWLLDPTRKDACFYRRGEQGWITVLASCEGIYITPLLPGFALDLGRLWQRLDAKLRMLSR
jgi:Uma2 family endonuclease